MNCALHNDVAAVAQCAHCGVGICNDCRENSTYAIDGKPLCRNCDRMVAEDVAVDARKTYSKTRVKIIVGAVSLVLALVAFFTGHIFLAFVLASIGSFGAMWKGTQRTEQEKFNDKIDNTLADIKHGEGAGMMNSAIGFIVRVVLCIAFGAVVTPVMLVINLVKPSKLRAEAEEAEQLAASMA